MSTNARPQYEFASVDEFRAAVGQELGVSEWLTITQQRIDAFAEVTGDRQWIHVDPAQAAQGPHGATIAHGYLTLSLLPLLSQSTFEVRGARMVINYGLDRVRFPAPVLVDSRIRVAARLISVTDGPGGTQAVVRYTFEIEGSPKPACVADTIRLLVP